MLTKFTIVLLCVFFLLFWRKKQQLLNQQITDFYSGDRQLVMSTSQSTKRCKANSTAVTKSDLQESVPVSGETEHD